MTVMPARRILLLGDPLLRAVSQPVARPASVQPLIDDLRDTLAEFRRAHGFGRGISAVQIGDASRVIYMEVDGAAYELVNPEFAWKSSDTFWLWDDCFSFPDLMVWLERSTRIQLRYQTPAGENRQLDAEGSFAELIQHEMDHLDGILAVDHAKSPLHLALRPEVLKLSFRPPV